MEPRIFDLCASWQGNLLSDYSEGTYVETAAGALVAQADGRRVATFRSSVTMHGAAGFVQAETSEHRILIEAEPHLFTAIVNEHTFLQLSRTNGEMWEGFNKCVGAWTRFCHPSSQRIVLPCVAGDQESTRWSHLRWGAREIATIRTGAGNAFNRACVSGPRIARANPENDREELAVFIVALLETCFFGVIDAPGRAAPSAPVRKKRAPRSAGATAMGVLEFLSDAGVFDFDIDF